ncbi:MAG: RNA methyltransferase, partial [Pseudomonadota bacterium]
APIARKLVRRCRRSGVRAVKLTPEEYRSLSDTSRASGVAAIVRQKWAPLEQISVDQGLCWVVVEKVRSPGNLGTLIRTSQAVGGAGFIFVHACTDPYSPAVVRSAMGAVYSQTFIRSDWASLRRWAAEQQRAVIGATPDGPADLHSFAFPKAPLLVFGEERTGLNESQRITCSGLVSIPMQSGTDSLNLGVAGSLVMYEVYRQQNLPEKLPDWRPA